MSITTKEYGTLPDGRTAHLHTLTNPAGLTAEITDFGGIIVRLLVPDRVGKFADIVLGKPDLAGYLSGHPYFGAITGRVAGRITGAKFTLHGTTYPLAANNGSNHLHGGLEGFDKVLWKSQVEQDKLRLHHVDPDGANGYPGNLDGTVTYALLEDNSLEITYEFTTDKPTPLVVTNHSYFNLAGESSGDITGHTLQILADRYAVTDDKLTLLGEIRPVAELSNDFREPALLGDRIPNLHLRHGDNYFFEEGRTAEPRLVSVLSEPTSGRVMETWTTEPGVQFYTGVMIDTTGKNGAPYPVHGALCLETQACPEAVNTPALGDVVLRPGQTHTSKTLYRFKTR